MVPSLRCLAHPVVDRADATSRPQRQCHRPTMQAAFKASIGVAGDRVPANPTYEHVWFAIAASLGCAGT